jgi:hypothetical protein
MNDDQPFTSRKDPPPNVNAADDLEFELSDQIVERGAGAAGGQGPFRVHAEVDPLEDMAIDQELEAEVSQWLSDPELSRLSHARPPAPKRNEEPFAESADDWDDLLHDFAADLSLPQPPGPPRSPAKPAPDETAARPAPQNVPPGQPTPAPQTSHPAAFTGSAETIRNLSSSADTGVMNPAASGAPAAIVNRPLPATSGNRNTSVDATVPSPGKHASAPRNSGDGASPTATAVKKSPAAAPGPGKPAAKRVSPPTSPAPPAAGSAIPSPSADSSSSPDLFDNPVSDDLFGDLGYDVVSGPAAPVAAPSSGPSRLHRLRRVWKRWPVWKKSVAIALPLVGVLWIGALLYQQSMQSDEPAAYPPAARRTVAAAPPVESRDRPASPPGAAAAAPNAADASGKPPMAAADDVPMIVPAVPVVELGVAYGTEKRSWLEWAEREFSTTPDGRQIRVRLIPLGSLESAHAILDGDRRIHVWAPASSLYREALVRDWEAKRGGNPLLKEEPLALTPMVIVMWKKRFEAFTVKSPVVSLRTIRFAMRAPRGWDTIAGKPTWGRFKFAYTHPNQSNSGLMTLVVLAYEFFGKTSGLSVSDVMSAEFQDHLTAFARGVSYVSNSTGNLMREMTLKGPTSCDAAIVYESVAIEYLERAEGRWDRLQVIYPQQNLWNDNPYCILNTQWTTPETQRAAETFLKFLLSEQAQLKALEFGFRPANSAVSIKGPESPFTKYADNGVSVELPEICEVPSRDVMENLLQAWIRNSETQL